MISITQKNLLKLVNEKLKKMPNYFTYLKVSSVKKEGNIFIFHAEGFSDGNGNVDPEKFALANELINQVNEDLKINSSYNLIA